MKTVYKLFHATVLTLCSAIMLSSCDSFLDTKPYDFTAPETFYSNYNPQIEMFARFKMKSSFHKTKRII